MFSMRAIALLVACGCGRIGFDASSDGSPTTIRNVFVIVLTSQPWSTIHGSASAPFLNSLLPNAAHAEAYRTPPGGYTTSEPYNIWFEAGSSLGTTMNGGPLADHQTTTMHLTTLLQAAGISWKAYQEGIPGDACPVMGIGGYYIFHDPFVYFDDVVQDTASCI